MVERIAFSGMLAADAAKLSKEQYMKLIKSRQRRSVKRNSMQYRELLAKAEEMGKAVNRKPIKTHMREAVILPSWIGLTFSVYNGKEFQPFEISAGMLGHRLGEFAYSTKRVLHSAPGIRATRGSKFLAVK
jgi:small subunit ribosomal protein S19